MATRAPGARVPHRELERKAERLFATARLKPVRQVEIRHNGDFIGRVDYAFIAEKIVIELDGRTDHDTDDAFEQDRYRDAQLQAIGWRVLRFTWRDLTQRQQHVIDSIRATLTRARNA